MFFNHKSKGTKHREMTSGRIAAATAKASTKALDAVIKKYKLPYEEASMVFIKEYARTLASLSDNPQEYLDEVKADSGIDLSTDD